MSKCKTPGAEFGIGVHANGTVFAVVSLPHWIALDESCVNQLQRRLHDAIENVLAETFQFGCVTVYPPIDKRRWIPAQQPKYMTARKKP